MSVREVVPGTAEYEALVELRNEVLRRPVGQSITEDERDDDRHARHFGLFENDFPVACALLRPREHGVQVRQVAVRSERHGEGLGRRIMEVVETVARESGIGELYLNARKPVIPFYERLGWTAEGPEFSEIGIPHRRMRKRINAPAGG